MGNERLLVLDGHSLAFRAFYSRAPENFRTTSGVYTNAVHGFFSMLISMIRQEKPTHIAAAFDLSRHSFRTDIYPEYKGGRAETPEEFIGQPKNIQRILDAMKITWLTKKNIEADDILATLATKASDKGIEVLISSGDRDTFQLISENVTVLYPSRSISNTSRMTPQAIKDRYDVWPEQYPEIAALSGEKADNLPGVPLVGEKVAAKWLNQYGSLEEIYAHADEFPGKRGENLREHIEDVKRNRKLNKLRTDLELPVTLEDLQWKGFDYEAVNAICRELEFSQMQKQITDLGKYLGMELPNETPADKLHSSNDTTSKSPEFSEYSINPAEPEVSDIPGYASMPQPEIRRLDADISAEEFSDWLKSEADQGVGLWAVGNLSVVEPRIDYLLLAKLNHAEKKTSPSSSAVLVTVSNLSYESDKELAKALSDSQLSKTVYDAKSLRHAILAQGWELNGEIKDVNLLDYLSDSDAPRSKFSQVTQRTLGWSIDEKPSDLNKISEQMTLDINLDPDPNSSKYTEIPQTLQNQAKYAVSLLQMEPYFTQLLASRSGNDLLKLEYSLSNVLLRMEHTGIGADTEVLNTYFKELESEVEKAQNAAFESIGREVNLSSPKQLQDILFNQLQLPPTRKTKTGYTTDAKALEELAQYNPHPFLDALLYHRDRIKLLQIVKTLQDRIDADGRIHTTYGQTIAATGRLSSLDPNLQNIPARSTDGARIREAFIAITPYVNLMSVDYSQIEMRIMAHLSEDAGLIDAFASGEDLHRSVAALVFGIAPEEVTSSQRSQVKATSYGLAYGLSAFGLAGQLRIAQKEAKSLMEAYFARFHNVRDYLNQVVIEARQAGYTQTMFGRRRYLPGLLSTNRVLAENARRAALNAPIQGTAADLMKMAMLQVDSAISQSKMRSRVLLQVHDELVLEVAPGEQEELSRLVEKQMTQVAELRVPLQVSVGIGANWLSAAH